MTSYGVIFQTVPLFSSSSVDTSPLWTLATLLSRVEYVWKIICDTDLCTSEWYGWMLVYLEKNVSIDSVVENLLMTHLNIDTCQLCIASYKKQGYHN